MPFSGISPCCPKCGSVDGSLGTSYAYFMCNVCKDCVYWTEDHGHPGDWETAIKASPWARTRQALSTIPYGPQPTIEECARHIADINQFAYRLAK